MTKIWRVIGVLAVGGLLGGACSSPGSSGGAGGKPGSGGAGGRQGSGGAGGSGGTSSGGGGGGGANGGSAGNGGATSNEVVVPCAVAGGAGGGAGTAGVAGAGGAPSPDGGKGGVAGSAGAGGRGGGSAGGGGGASTSAAGGKGGSGTAGAGGSAGAPPTCEQFPSLATGPSPSSFTVSSKAFSSCGTIPVEHTCDQKPFPQGTSPPLEWTAGPAGTMSYAVVFKDLSVLARYDSTSPNYNKGFHYVIWDIPASVTALPAGMKNGYASPDVAGALQWSNFNDYGYFGPCPNYDPTMPTSYDDSYAFVVYALPAATTTIPAPQMGISSVRLLDGVFQKNALATAEYRGTSHAASSEIPAGTLPPKSAPPCPSDGSLMCGCVMRANAK